MKSLENKQPIWTKTFISLFCTNLSVFTVFYGLVTTLPLYALESLNRSDKDAGLLMTIFLLSAILIRPFTGKILDLNGKRKMLWISLFFYLVCTVLYAFVKPFSGLLILRFVQGIWFSIATTASGSLAADNVPMSRRGAGLGYFTMSTNLAVVLGPMLALFIVQLLSFNALFIIMSILMLIGASLSLTIQADKKYEKSAAPKRPFSIHDLFEKKSVPIALLGSLISFSYASVLSFLSIYAQEKHLLHLATIFYLVYASAMLLTRPYTGRWFDEKGPKFVLIPGFVSFCGGLILLAFINSPLLFLLSGILIGFGYGALVPSLQTLSVQATIPERSGYATATFFTFFDIGIAVGSFVLGILAVHFGYQDVYVLSGILIFVILAFYLVVDKKKSMVKSSVEAKEM
ncbi:MFS transporter [Bacillus sp. FJAT-49732]|uniref:MFS transporter n=1 Tax=Lederbergia citrisecunda TaxID=2833583 RepID=A0A942TN06_9BACI|nr:MFS transporter [Lederbergia citrisecunda]MBS4200333.1 MFS transporter [Lederbergia citrisecunda]